MARDYFEILYQGSLLGAGITAFVYEFSTSEIPFYLTIGLFSVGSLTLFVEAFTKEGLEEKIT